jgi:hypothetical protein
MGEPADGDQPSDENVATDRTAAEAGPPETDGAGERAVAGEDPRVRPARPQWAPPSDGDFGWRGWVLVAVMLVSFLVVPGILVVLAQRPSLVGSVGLTFRDAYLALPMIPAILLAVVAVWAALHARR